MTAFERRSHKCLTVRHIKRFTEFRKLVPFLSRYRAITDTGKLAEWYCVKLFRLKLVTPRNRKGADAIDPRGKRVEIKHRLYSGRTPPGMRLDRASIDYVFYVELDTDLLPRRIRRINTRDLVPMSNGGSPSARPSAGDELEQSFHAREPSRSRPTTTRMRKCG